MGEAGDSGVSPAKAPRGGEGERKHARRRLETRLLRGALQGGAILCARTGEMWARARRVAAAQARIYTRRALRPARLQRNTGLPARPPARSPGRVAAAAIGASVAVPLLRKRLRIPRRRRSRRPSPARSGTAILFPRTKTRDAVLFAQQMWAFTVVHELPYDDPEALRRRLKVRYPIVADRMIGLGQAAELRGCSGGSRRPEDPTSLDRFADLRALGLVPRAARSLIFILTRDNPNFARAARQMAAAYDLGCAGYFAVPTAPPWWASENGYTGDEKMRRLMVPVGEEVWGDAWPKLYKTPAATPGRRCRRCTSAPRCWRRSCSRESSKAAGAVGWAYAACSASRSSISASTTSPT